MGMKNKHPLRPLHCKQEANQQSTLCPVTEALHQSSHGSLRHVQCELCEGMVVLHGWVPTFYLKQLAQELVKNVDAVDHVINRINVGYQ